MNASTADETARPGPVPLWEVPDWQQRFGVRAGITGRGEAPEPFDLGLWGTAPVGGAMGRWRALRASLTGFPTAVLAHQIHGDRVLWHTDVEPGWLIVDGVDGHATASPGQLLLITVADCVPIYLLAPARRAIALLHSGWRGTAAGILSRGLEVLRERASVEPSDVVMHLGIAICGSCYQVGSEVRAALGLADVAGVPGHADLRALLAQQAEALGVAEVSVSTRCTSCDARQFFSHRRSGGRDGRMVAYLGMPTA